MALLLRCVLPCGAFAMAAMCLALACTAGLHQCVAYADAEVAEASASVLRPLASFFRFWLLPCAALERETIRMVGEVILFDF